jgi:hypothetical protein
VTPCRSGKHHWLDPISADRCCNGWRRELRIPRAELGDDLGGSQRIPEGTLVWVKVGVED